MGMEFKIAYPQKSTTNSATNRMAEGVCKVSAANLDPKIDGWTI